MLSAMTTSENFPLINQSRCSPSPTFDAVVQPSSYVASILRQNFQIMSANDGDILKYRLMQEPEIDEEEKIGPAISYYYPADARSEKSDSGFSGSDAGRMGYGDVDVVEGGDIGVDDYDAERRDSENDLTDLLDQLDLDDSVYEQSKPLKIDPNVLKLDFGKISFSGDLATLEKLYTSDITENRRASHHLSGGSLVTDASQGETSPRLGSGNGLLDTVNVAFIGGISRLSNQVSPSTPLTFDLSSGSEAAKGSQGVGALSNLESTNPFRNSIDFVAETEVPAATDEGDDVNKAFSPTNPFSDYCGSSSLTGSCVNSFPHPQYENVLIPQKSFSQCSTRPASPVLKIPAESSSSTTAVSNPFLINETSPETLLQPAPHLFPAVAAASGSTSFQPANPTSFIFAVPVFSFLQQQQNITNSSTQTVDPIVDDEEEILKRLESRSFAAGKNASGPVYQNLMNHLEKFMKLNDHSEYDLECLKKTVKDLRTSGWYYENVSWQESVILLRDTEPGTFLIRDSSDPSFLFSLSVQTSRGPTSVRLHYVNGQFRLDAEEKLIPHMPSFGSVIELIDYYVEKTIKNKTAGGKGKKGMAAAASSTDKISIQKSRNQVWIDSQGNVYSNILLVKPLRRRDHFSSLQHLARLTINTHVKKRSNAKVKLGFKVTAVYEASPFHESSFQNNVDQFCPILSTDALPIPPRLIEYLQDYPYCH